MDYDSAECLKCAIPYETTPGPGSLVTDCACLSGFEQVYRGRVCAPSCKATEWVRYQKKIESLDKSSINVDFLTVFFWTVGKPYLSVSPNHGERLSWAVCVKLLLCFDV